MTQGNFRKIFPGIFYYNFFQCKNSGGKIGYFKYFGYKKSVAFHMTVNEFILFIQNRIFCILNNFSSIISKYYLKSPSNFTSVMWKMLNSSIFMLDFFDWPHISRTKMSSIYRAPSSDHVAPPTHFNEHFKAHDIDY